MAMWGELQPAVAVKFVTPVPSSAGEQRQIIKVTSATILACDCHVTCAHCATGATSEARSDGDTPHTSGQGEDSTQGQGQGMGTAVGCGAASLLCQCPMSSTSTSVSTSANTTPDIFSI